MKELQEIKDKADYYQKLCEVKTPEDNFKSAFELIIRLADVLIDRDKKHKEYGGSL